MRADGDRNRAAIPGPIAATMFKVNVDVLLKRRCSLPASLRHPALSEKKTTG
jgi:hypothetical protein